MQEPRQESAPVEAAFIMRERDLAISGGSTRIATIVCEPLKQAGFVNAFSTRIGGVSPLPSNALSLAYFNGDAKETSQRIGAGFSSQSELNTHEL
jgi:hypothetical protein